MDASARVRDRDRFRIVELQEVVDDSLEGGQSLRRLHVTDVLADEGILIACQCEGVFQKRARPAISQFYA